MLLGVFLLVAAAPANGAYTSTPTMSAAEVDAFLKPQLTFVPDDPPTADPAAAGGAGAWQAVARTLTSLQKLDCGHDADVDKKTTGKELELLEATEAMLEAAADGDALAMSGLGHLYLLGDACSPKRNLTWATHWLDGAAELGQPDALAMLGFLAESKALQRVYNYTAHPAGGAKAGRGLYERAVTAGGSMLASMALGSQLADGSAATCPAAAAHYEAAAIAAIAALDVRRRRTTEMGWLESNADAKTLLRGNMGERDRVDASSVEYMDYCAHVGDTAGQVGMGHIYHAGTHGVPRDKAAAEHWFAQAAQRSDPMGHANLGLMRLRARDGAGALGPLRRAAKRNDPSGWAGIGYAYYYGLGLPQNHMLAAKAIAAAARLGHLDAIYNLGVLAIKGQGMEPSVSKAHRFWSVAAEFAHPMAQLQVGRMKARGLGVVKACSTALFFLQHAAAAGPAATHLLESGLAAYEAGRPQRALMHYLLAAHIGLEPAQTNAGFLYSVEMPKLLPANAEGYRGAAHEYFRRAAIQGSVDASIQLANLLSDDALPAHARDLELANSLYAEAASHGSTDAMWHLGYNHLKGRGVARDWGRAWALMREGGMHSRYASLHGAERLAFGAIRALYEVRVMLALVALGSMVLATQGKRAPGGGGAQVADWEDKNAVDDFDDFA